jgi:hypothetical protein
MIIDHGQATEAVVMQAAGPNFSKASKVNLRYEEGENGEGIWAAPCTDADRAVYEGPTVGASFFVHLLNAPLNSDVRWGSKVECLTNGELRPYSKEIASNDIEYSVVKDALLLRGQVLQN